MKPGGEKKKKKKKRKRMFFPRAKKSLVRKRYEMFNPLVYDRELISGNILNDPKGFCPFTKNGDLHIAYFNDDKDNSRTFEIRNLEKDDPYQIIHSETVFRKIPPRGVRVVGQRGNYRFNIPQPRIPEPQPHCVFFNQLKLLITSCGGKTRVFDIQSDRIVSRDHPHLTFHSPTLHTIGDSILFMNYEYQNRVIDLSKSRKPPIDFRGDHIIVRRIPSNKHMRIKNVVQGDNNHVICRELDYIIVVDIGNRRNYTDDNKRIKKLGCCRPRLMNGFTNSSAMTYSIENDRLYTSGPENRILVFTKILDFHDPQSIEYVQEFGNRKIELDGKSAFTSIFLYNKFLICNRDSYFRFNIFDLRREEECFGSFLTEYCFQDNIDGKIEFLKWPDESKKKYIVMRTSKTKAIHGWKNILFDRIEKGKMEVKERCLDMLDFFTQDDDDDEEEEEEEEEGENCSLQRYVIEIKMWNKNVVLYKFLLL